MQSDQTSSFVGSNLSREKKNSYDGKTIFPIMANAYGKCRSATNSAMKLIIYLDVYPGGGGQDKS